MNRKKIDTLAKRLVKYDGVYGPMRWWELPEDIRQSYKVKAAVIIYWYLFPLATYRRLKKKMAQVIKTSIFCYQDVWPRIGIVVKVANIIIFPFFYPVMLFLIWKNNIDTDDGEVLYLSNGRQE